MAQAIRKQGMNLSQIYTKTAKAILESSSRSVTREHSRVLSMIDGKTTVGEILEKNKRLSQNWLAAVLDELISAGLVRSANDGGPNTQMEELGFSSTIIVDETNTQAFFDAQAEAERLAGRENTRAKEEEARRHNLLVNVKADIAAEAAAMKRDEEKRKAAKAAATRAEENQRREAETKARAAAEAAEIARKQAEQKARAEAEAKLQAAEAARLKAEQASRAREAAATARAQSEQQAREAAERKAQAEAQARRAAEDKAAAEAAARQQAEAEAQARREAEAKAAAEAEQQATLRAEMQAKLNAMEEAQQRAEEQADLMARQLEEARLAAELEARAKRRLEARAKEEGEARERQAAEAQARIEQESRLRAEAEAKAAEEAEARRQAELAAAAQLEAERVAREEAERKAQEEAQAKAQAEQALQRAEQEAAAQAEQARQEAVAQAEQARQEAAAEAQARIEAERKAREEAEARAREATEQRQAEQLAAERAAAERQEREESEARERDAIALLHAAQAGQDARAEAETRIRAEEAARQATLEAELELERHARVEAEARAQQESEAREIEEARRHARETADAQARAEAEEAQRRVDEENRREQEEEERLREEAQQRAKAAAELAMGHYVAPRARFDRKWLRYAARGFGLMLLGLLGLVHLLSFNAYLPTLEAQLEHSLGQRVAIQNLHFSVFPAPHWRMEGVSIGNAQQVQAARIDLTPTLGSWFSQHKRVRKVEIESAVLTASSLDLLPDWRKTQSAAPPFAFAAVRVLNTRLSIPGIDLPPFHAEIEQSAGRLGTVHLMSVDQRVTMDLVPQGETLQLQISARHFALPLLPRMEFDRLRFSAIARSGRVTFSDLDGEVYGGSVSGSGEMQWGESWNLTAELDAKRISLQPALVAVSREVKIVGLLDTKMHIAASAPKLAELMDAPQVQATFHAREGEIDNFDLVGALHAANRGAGLSGGKTHFNDLTGFLRLAKGRYDYQQLKLNLGVVSATGNLLVNQDRSLNGNLLAELRARTTTMRVPLSISGHPGDPVLKAAGGTTGATRRAVVPATVVPADPVDEEAAPER